jgi:hypothetical protein
MQLTDNKFYWFKFMLFKKIKSTQPSYKKVGMQIRHTNFLIFTSLTC